MNDIPNAQEAAKQAKAAAEAPKYLNPKVAEQITRAIKAGCFTTTLEYAIVGNWQYTTDALRSRGYRVEAVQTGHNETGMKVSWQETGTAADYYAK